jgi:hypothetical protein
MMPRAARKMERKLGDPCHVGCFSPHTLCSLLGKMALTPVFAERCLGQYHTREVMMLQALTNHSGQAGGATQNALLPGWMHTMAEMSCPRQIGYALACMRRRKKPPLSA